MKFRKLRIIWSVFWALACVLLIVLWVRSYSWYDFTKSGEITSANGKLYVGRNVAITRYADQAPFAQELISNRLGMLSITSAGVTAEPSGPGVTLPFWHLLMSTVALGAISWVRFSVRALLIATTLVAAVLSFAVYAARK